MRIEFILIMIVAALAVGVFVGMLLRRKLAESRIADAERASTQIVEEAKKEADSIRKEAVIQAKDTVLEAKADWEKEARELRRELQAQEKRLLQKEENLDRKIVQLDDREGDLGRREKALLQQEEQLKSREQEIGGLIQEQRTRLENISGMKSEEAKQQLMMAMESEARHDAAKRIKEIEDEARETADKKAKEILALAIQRYAGDFVAEKTVSVVPLPSDEMKGRIIGREGRNIRAFEALTGVNLIIDDTPEAVVLSCFDPVRREVARQTLEKLVADGRIHPARIEEMYYQSKAELDDHIRQAGEQAVFEANCGEFQEEIVKILGRLRYRTSYGQNVLKHTLEVVQLAGIMASELDASVKTAKRAALLHDLGKALTHEVEGSHALISAGYARRYGETQGVVHAIEAHHYEVQPQTVEAVLLIAADAISASRPGARGESLESYIKRLEALEEIAASKDGVEKVYALQAGREIRVMVKPAEIDDDAAALLSHQIAREIEDQLEYPGQVKVTVIRESRAVEIAN